MRPQPTTRLHRPALRRCRETAAARIALGSALFDSGDRAAAKIEFERALVLAPDSAEARDWLKKIGG